MPQKPLLDRNKILKSIFTKYGDKVYMLDNKVFYALK